MMGPSHKLFGATAGVAFAAATGQPWHIIAMTGFVAKSTSHGWASPDVDQYNVTFNRDNPFRQIEQLVRRRKDREKVPA